MVRFGASAPSVHLANDLDERVIQRETCDIVILKIVERTLIWSPAGEVFDGG